VRAGLLKRAEDYSWSSAPVHCGASENDGLLDLAPWRELWDPRSWRNHLSSGDTCETDDMIRRCTHTGRPLGAPEFVKQLEHSLQRRLAPAKGGRPQREKADLRQTAIAF
jgi:putative transposase